MKQLYFICLVILVASSCTKEEKLEVAGNEPVISFVGITPTEVEDFKNSISLVIHYKDQNGDIGFLDPDVYALWVKDSRLDSADWYHVAPLAPIGQELRIEGNLQIVLNSMFIIGNGNVELASLAIKVRDRANNWSNIIYSPPITIKKL